MVALTVAVAFLVCVFDERFMTATIARRPDIEPSPS
jgi:hypothetical protein